MKKISAKQTKASFRILRMTLRLRPTAAGWLAALAAALD